MEKKSKSQVSIKIFIGFELTTEVRIHLAQNIEWKQASVSNTAPLKEARFQEKEYLGIFFENEMVPMKQLTACQLKVLQSLEHYCPEINMQHLKLSVFPQVFVS